MIHTDEVGAIVVDVGSHSVRTGFAGEEAPKASFPSAVGVGARGDHALGELALMHPQLGMNVTGVDGLAPDWPLLEKIYDYSVSRCLGLNAKEHPLLTTEPPYVDSMRREKLATLAFETLGVPALYVAKSPVLVAYAVGKTSGLVVDSGHMVTTCTPVVEGYALYKPMVYHQTAGAWLTRQLLSSLQTRGVNVRPRHAFSKKQVGDTFKCVEEDYTDVTTSYHTYSQLAIVEDMKETCCRVSEVPCHKQTTANVPSASYELPDGTVVELGQERFLIPERLFSPSALNPAAGSNLAPPGEFASIHALVEQAREKCDQDIRKEMYSNTILTGGNTLINGFVRRFDKEVHCQAPSIAKAKAPLVPPGPTERKNAAWIGGSILASLPTFQQLWISRAEYHESGPNIIHTKCP